MLAALILALIVYFFVRLVGEAKPAFAHDGVLRLHLRQRLERQRTDSFGALPLVVGTLITSGSRC